MPKISFNAMPRCSRTPESSLEIYNKGEVVVPNVKSDLGALTLLEDT
jgi:hypothetical protein